MSLKKYKTGLPVVKDFIKSVAYLDCGNTIKTVVCTKLSCYNAALFVCGKYYGDCFNDDEPYDRKSHVFYVDKGALSQGIKITFAFRPVLKFFSVCHVCFTYKCPVFADENNLINEYDSKLLSVKEETEVLYAGVMHKHILFNDKNSMPVHGFMCQSDLQHSSVYVGTPSDGYESVKVRATIPEMADSAEENGKKVIAATNGDFFDIFGDFHPAGLCIKNGKIIANANSERPFFAMDKNGKAFITDKFESGKIMNSFEFAVSGNYMILKNGEIYNYAPLEPFSYVRHPRTCVGIRKDGSVIILVIDGRIPEYSNGATLVDLAKLMQLYGADRALNLDGGGSSAMYIKKDGKLKLQSRPADLFKPAAGLIRKDYNSLMFIQKNNSKIDK